MPIENRTHQVSGAPALSFVDMDLSIVNPIHSAKFSPNLYAFLTAPANKALAQRARVWCDEDGVLYIGYFDDTDLLIGARLSQVLCYGRKAQVTCPINLGGLAEVEDFWDAYIEDGRCAIDVAHKEAFINDDSRWKVEGDTRKCMWCFKHTQKLFTKLVTKESKEWRQLEPA